ETVGFETGVVQMCPFAAILAVGCGESVGVGAFEGEIRLPETSLRIANLRAGGIVRSVIGRLRDEPWELPAGVFAGCMDKSDHHSSIGVRIDIVLRGLMRIGLSLVPEERAKAMDSELVDPQHHPCEERAVADERSIGVCSDESCHGGH